MAKEITKKKCYRLINSNNPGSLSDIVCGIWITTYSFYTINALPWEKSSKISTIINDKIFDDSIKDCCIFAYLDEQNYGSYGDKYIEITWDELVKECETIEVVCMNKGDTNYVE